jgi:hypothetical protein
MSIIIQKDNPNDPLHPRIYRMNNNDDGTFTYTRLNNDFSEYKNPDGKPDSFNTNEDLSIQVGYRQIQEQRGGKKQKKSNKSKKQKKSNKSKKQKKSNKSIRRRK